MTHRYTPVIVFTALAACLAGCDPSGQTPCEPACEQGLSCDTDSGECRAPRLSLYEHTLPGRSMRLAAVGERVIAAAIDPDSDELLVGEFDTTEAGVGESRFFVLAQLGRSQHKKIAMAASESTVATAWLADDDSYRIGLYRADDPAERWRVLPPITAERADYRGSEHFDVSINDSGRIQLVFHDRRRRILRRLSGRAEDDTWQADTIDDPSEEDDASVCSSQQRRLASRGVGYFPDVAIDSGATFVAYQDGDCADLRLARRIDGEWVASVIDTGDFDKKTSDDALTPGQTGQFASVGFDSRGNLAIAYQDAGRGRLMVAFEHEGQFSIEEADAGYALDTASRNRKHLVGGFASLIFDDDDIAWVAYLDQTTSRLRLAKRTRELDLGGDWVRQTVDAPGPTGYSASLVNTGERGLFVGTEHLQPQAGGLASSLQFFDEEAF
ncbi:MAG: hypothetical protein ACLFVJ_14140 [Persicimonas sp.]